MIGSNVSTRAAAAWRSSPACCIVDQKVSFESERIC